MKINFPLLALAIGAFSIGTTEFSPMGLLPIIAQGIDASIPKAGMLITAYAIGVMVGAPLMTLLLLRYSQRAALIFLMGIFTVGNLCSAFSVNFTTLLLSRLLTSLNHGAFFGLGALVATQMVAKEKQASAVATMFMGLTIANIGGVPAATWLGQLVGWRSAFLAIALLGLLTMLSLLFSLPKSHTRYQVDLRQEWQVLTRPAVLLALCTTVLGASAMFTLYTYIAPVLQHITSASPAFLTLALVLIGIGFTLGNYIGGKLADYSTYFALVCAFILLIAIMMLLPYTAQTKVGAAITMVIWGIATFAVVPSLQMKVMQAAHDAPTLASSINIGAFNLGNAFGAAAGGSVIALHWSYAMVPIVGALLAVIGLGLAAYQKPSRLSTNE